MSHRPIPTGLRSRITMRKRLRVSESMPLTYAWVVPAGGLVEVVDVVDLALVGDGLLPAGGQGRQRLVGRLAVQRRRAHRLARVGPRAHCAFCCRAERHDRRAHTLTAHTDQRLRNWAIQELYSQF